MMRSLFSGVAGLRTHQTKMDVIGNNIANVNTTAYKSQSTTFRDLMYQTTQAASGANAESGVGGINAKQIGLGVQVGAINTNIKGQGSAQNTGNAFDIMITGEAFFIVNNGIENFFTRDGSFYVDGAGNLAMTSSGYNVMGWQVDPETGDPKEDTVSALQVMHPDNLTYEAAATTNARVTGIVDKNDTSVNSTSGRIMNLEFYDKKGYLYTARLSIHGTGDDPANVGRYYVTLDSIIDSGSGKAIDDAEFQLANFGAKEQDMAVSIGRNSTSTPELAGTFVITNSTVNPAVPINATFGTAITPPLSADLIAAYGVAANASTTNPRINQKGQLVTDEKTYSLVEGYTAGSFATTGVKIGNDTFTPGEYTVTRANGVATIAGPTGGTAANLTPEMISNAYNGLDLFNEEVNSFIIEQDGSLTITNKTEHNVANLVFNTGTGLFESINGNNEITLGLANLTGGMFEDISIDFSKVKNVNNGGSSTVGAAKGTVGGLGTGRKIGDMIGISIAKDGIITASYDNGMSKCLGQIATATFANASGLEKQGDNLYSATMNSGDFDGIGQDITANGGYMQSGVLEMSNVDLSQEFTEMITTQRGFQANSRIITVSDSLLEELTNLKR